jgi:hypothetical protein
MGIPVSYVSGMCVWAYMSTQGLTPLCTPVSGKAVTHCSGKGTRSPLAAPLERTAAW